MPPQPFALQMNSVIESLQNMSSSLDNELRALLAFYGENPESPEAPKPEDFFGLILSFSSSLQKAALEVHDSMPKPEPPSPKIHVQESTSPPGDSVSFSIEVAVGLATFKPTSVEQAV